MEYRIIESSTGNAWAHWDATHESESDSSPFSHEYISVVLREHADCVWKCEDDKGQPMLQYFIRYDSPAFTLPVVDAMAYVNASSSTLKC
jgi:hypothetical protein